MSEKVIGIAINNISSERFFLYAKVSNPIKKIVNHIWRIQRVNNNPSFFTLHSYEEIIYGALITAKIPKIMRGKKRIVTIEKDYL